MASAQQILLGLGGIPATLVKSVQQISVVIAAGATTGTQTFTAVNAANTVLFWGGIRGGNTTTNYATDTMGVVLTNGTTVTGTRNTADASFSIIAQVTVVEFNSASIQSIQTGTVVMTGTSSGANLITAYTAANSVVLFNGSTTTDTSASLAINAVDVYLSGGYVGATRGTTTNNVTVYYTVLEFAAGILNSSTQQNTITMASAATGTATISAVILAQTMIVYRGCTSNATASPDYYPWLTLTNTTTVTATRATGTATISAMFTVVEFKAADIKSMNRGSLVIALSAALASATISSVNTAKTMANWLGNTNSASGTPTLGESFGTITEFDATTIKASRVTADASTTETVGYEAIEFK